MSLLPPGSKLGRFQIASVLGQGAMGVVYLAHDPEIDRQVAIKTVRPEALSGEGAEEIEGRFLKEAKLAGRLQHPNVVTIFDVGRDGEVCFIAMEYVDGRPLSRYLGAAADLPLAVKVGIIRQAAEALAHAHERGVVHRDIKPGNILVSRDGRVKVTDFGIGRFTSSAASDLTRTGQMVGSPAYMSPEQIRGEKPDGRSDLFSLGVVLYELLTGARPFSGESITTLVYQILHTEPRDPRELKADLPASTREVMARLLAKQPDKRPADARAFIKELKRIEKFQRESEMTVRAAKVVPPPPPALPVGSPVAAPAPPPRRSGLAVVLVAAAVVLAAALLWMRERPVSAPATPSAPAPATSAAAAPTPEPAPPTEPAAEATPLPMTPAPEAAVVATGGAPRAVATRRPRPTPRAVPTGPPTASAVAEKPVAEPPAPATGRPERVDAAYRTRRSVRFTSSPEQARLYVDGRYVGIADDWDNRGGGRAFEFEKSGSHWVRLELPGYRTMNIEIDVVPEADDSVSIDEELERRTKEPYEKLPAVAERTTSAIEFLVQPADALVSENGKVLGAASSFGPGSPLELSGPRVHELLLSAPGHQPKLVRILVAWNAGRERAKVSEKLKPE